MCRYTPIHQWCLKFSCTIRQTQAHLHKSWFLGRYSKFSKQHVAWNMVKLTPDKWYLAAQIPDVQWQRVFGCGTHFIEVGLAGLLRDTRISQQSAWKCLTPCPHQWMPGSLPRQRPRVYCQTLTTQLVWCNHVYFADTTLHFFLCFFYLR